MKVKQLLIFIAGVLIVPAYLASCGEDRWAAYSGQTQTDRWIDDTMRVWYYWNEEIPNTNKLNYFQEPFTFYASLLSGSDGKGGRHYSTIDSLTSHTRSIPYTDYSYGLQFTTNRVVDNDTALYAHVLYVAPGSPASDIALERGDWIMEMNGQPITNKNYALLYGNNAMQLTIGKYDAEEDTIIACRTPRDIASARPVNDHPVHYKNIYIRGDRRIGYLVYNHFSSGITSGSSEYDNDLREASQYFAAQQVNEFILDLRYNNGGLLSCAQLLCALLAPADRFGQELGFMEFNARHQPQKVSFSLNQSLIQNGANLNLKRLYVLTSSQTASASEMVINCLKPLMEDVVLIGATTEGKNVGSTTFSNPELMITMNPIVCKIYNSEGESDYASGFKPDIPVNENYDMAAFLPFGDPNELMLNTALTLIEEGRTPVKAKATTSKNNVLYSSVERLASHAVEIRY